jgi:hypothetical protein
LHRANLNPVTPERRQYHEITTAIGIELIDLSITPYGGFGGACKKAHGKEHDHVQFGTWFDLERFVHGTELE